MMKLKRNQKGFTLIEVLLIVVILGIIAAIAIPRLMATRQEAQENSCHSTVANINTAAEKFYFDTGAWPADLAALVTGSGGVIYLPDGTPTCPASGILSIDTTSHRAECTIHGNIYGST